jgi:D-alanyl-D-alanine dipeptidase
MVLPTDQVAPEWNPGAETSDVATEEPAPEGVGAEPSTEEPAPDAAGDDAVDWQTQATDAQDRILTLQGDIDNIKSTSDRQMFQLQQQYAEEREVISDRMAELEMRDMDDDAKTVYLQEREVDRLEQYGSSLEDREWQLQQRESMVVWNDFFVNRMGIEPNTVKMDQSFDEFHAQGWAATEQLVGDLRTRNDQLEQVITANELTVPNTPVTPVRGPVGKTPPKVTTKTPGIPPGKRRMADVPITDREELFAAFERGEISAEDLPV